MENLETKTPLDEKYDAVIKFADDARIKIEDFKGKNKKRFDEQQLNAHLSYVKMEYKRYTGKEYGEEVEYNALDDDKALEALLYIYGNRDGQMFSDKYDVHAFPGSYYDDYQNGVDVIYWIPSKEKGNYGVNFTVDACTATLDSKVAEKFKRVDYLIDAKNDKTPGCNQVTYYERDDDEKKDWKIYTSLRHVPNYIVGASPAAISTAMDKFDASQFYLPNEADTDLSKKFLIEILLQAQAGIYACDLIENKSKYTQEARDKHRTVQTTCYESLRSLFKIKGGEETNDQLNQLIKQFIQEHGEKDDVFNTICMEADTRRLTRRKILRGRKAKKIAETTTKKS